MSDSSTDGPTPGPGALVLGPLLRYVDQTSAAVWVETREAGEVSVTAGGRSWSSNTFGVHGHHYALVHCDGLEPGSVSAYQVAVGGGQVWPPSSWGDLPLPPPAIATLKPGKPLRLAFGSCRTSVPHDRSGNRLHGVDALRAYALAMAGVTTEDEQALPWPDLVAFLGDQVYADETSEEMREFIAARRDLDEPPGTELKDFEEYAYLYKIAWSDPAIAWLLSTLPSDMIFDDHDVRDDWNTSAQWRQDMEATSWWHGRIVAALSSYWVYQHLGNLSPADRAQDEVWQQIAAHTGAGELDLTEALDAFAERVDRRPESYRWSHARDIAGTRLVVVDSRAARVLPEADSGSGEGERAMLDEGEMRWLEEQLTGDVEHVLVGTSLPFLLPEGLHRLEAFSEALAGGAWGQRLSGAGERLRQGGDLEHWGAFERSFTQVAQLAKAVVTGERGRPPRTFTFLSGDVHHSYVSQVRHLPPGAVILQAVCSPIRNPLPRAVRFATAALAYGFAAPGMLATWSAKVPDPPFRWRRVRGPWFDNNLATLEVTAEGLELWWATGKVRHGRHDRPELVRVATVVVDADGVARSSRGQR